MYFCCTCVQKRPSPVLPPNLDAEVPADGARLGVPGVSLAQHDASRLDHVESLPHHGHHGAGGHVLDQAGEEGLGLEVLVVLLQVGLAGLRRRKTVT